MRISLRWLRDYAELDAPLDTVVAALVDTGTEVNEIRREAAGAVVAGIVALEAVPESTKGVRFADLDLGQGEPVRVITAAPNIHVGDLVPYAPPGTLLSGWEEPLGVRAMFGGRYRSPGMLLSADELGVGTDAAGILVLSRGAPGQPLHEVIDLDVILDVEVTPNRPDCLCHVGIARELAAALADQLREPPTQVPAELVSASVVDGRAEVRIEDPVGCPRFTVAIIENVTVRPSPPWMQRRLVSVGIRPINNIVDVTNYVADELGQPLHAFDIARFRSAAGVGATQTAPVVVRRGRPGEMVLCLDGVEREVDADDIVVCAGDRPASLAGIIGGVDTAVEPPTRSVLLESASWQGTRVRATSRRLGVRTEASARFEKGLADTLPPRALSRAAALIAELGDGRVLRGVIDEHPAPLPPIEPIELAEGFLDGVLGYHVDVSEAATALARLGFGVTQDGGALTVAPPDFRRDVTIPVDVAEEVGRSLGYGRVPSTLPGRRSEIRLLAQPLPVEDRVRDVCVGAGFDEVITYSFISRRASSLLAGIGGGRTPVELRNPLSDEWAVMRTSVLPGACGALAFNLGRGLSEVSIFEVGRVFWSGERGALAPGSTADGLDTGLPPLPAEPLVLALLSQTGDGGAEGAARRLRHLQAVLGWLAEELAGFPLTMSPTTVAGFRPGRAATAHLDDRPVGLIGELAQETLAGFELRGRVVAGEVRLDAIAPELPRVPRFRAPARYPAVVQDLAVTVAPDALAGDALAAIRAAGGSLLEAVELYDEYRGEPLGEGRKGWTFRLTYRAGDRTLTSAEAQERQEAIALALQTRCGAEVRR